MQVKKIKIGTRLIDLYGKDCESFIREGEEYWFWFDGRHKAWELTNKHWHLITITCVRSGIAFYTINGLEDQIAETYMAFGSFMIRELRPKILDPKKQIPNFDPLDNTVCFDDEMTKIINFDNSHYYEHNLFMK